MNTHGYILLARGVLDHPVVGAHTRFSRSEAWLWLLFKAAFRPRTFVVGHAAIPLARGQLAHSTRYMAKVWKWPETNVRRFLRRLQTGAMIGAASGAANGAPYTVLTICNYERYQSPSFESGAASGAPRGARSGAATAQQRRKTERRERTKQDSMRSASATDHGFAEWYEAYPRKKSRQVAQRAFVKLMLAGSIALPSLLAKTRAFADDVKKWPKDRKQFVPYPASWLNAGAYDDEPDHRSDGGGSESAIAAPTRDPRTFTEAEWRERLEHSRAGKPWPSSMWGPPPGEPGCLVPPALFVAVVSSTRRAGA